MCLAFPFRFLLNCSVLLHLRCPVLLLLSLLALLLMFLVLLLFRCPVLLLLSLLVLLLMFLVLLLLRCPVLLLLSLLALLLMFLVLLILSCPAPLLHKCCPGFLLKLRGVRKVVCLVPLLLKCLYNQGLLFFRGAIRETVHLLQLQGPTGCSTREVHLPASLKQGVCIY